MTKATMMATALNDALERLTEYERLYGPLPGDNVLTPVTLTPAKITGHFPDALLPLADDPFSHGWRPRAAPTPASPEDPRPPLG